MSIQPALWKWLDHYSGSTFSAKSITFNFDVTGAIITCQLKPAFGRELAYEWKTSVNITVLNSLTGQIVLNQINSLNLPAGNYVYDLQIVFSNGTSQTYIKGSQKVTQEITL